MISRNFRRAAVASALLFLSSTAGAQTRPDTNRSDGAAAEAVPAGVPVVLGSDTVLWVRAGVGSFSVSERVEVVERRLRDLAGDPYLRLDTVRVLVDADQISVQVGERTVIAVTDADAALAGVPRDSLAREYARSIRRVLREQGFVARTRMILVGVLFAALSALMTFLVFRLANQAFPRIVAAIERGRGTSIPAVRIQNLEILSADQLAGALLGLVKVFRVVVLAGVLYLAVPVILSFFPWTRRFSEDLFGYILTPFAVIWAGLLGYLPNLFVLGAIAITTHYLLRLIQAVFVGIARERVTFTGFHADWAIPTYKLVRTLVFIFAFIAAWPYLPGSGSSAFQGVGVFVGLLLSLGSATAIGNVVGGVVLTYMRPFRVGDRVRIADTEGDIVEKSLLITRIRTTKNVEITIPNSMVLGSHIINYSASAKSHGLILHTTVTIGYDVPWREVHDLLVAAALSVPEIVRDPAPFVLQTSLQDYYPAYELNAYTDQPNRQAAVYARLHEAIQDRFNEAGVEILSPAYTALRDGNAHTIAPPHGPSRPETPGFRIVNADGRGDEHAAERPPGHGESHDG